MSPVVLTVSLAGVTTLPAPWLGVLSAAERQALARLRQPRDQISYGAAHALTRLALSRHLPGWSPAALPMRTGAFGKPAVALDHAPHFSLSHCSGLVGVALWPDGPVGLDVERIDPALATPQLARQIFTAAEYAALSAQPALPDAFTRLWTAKEAVIKADGRGLQLDLSALQIGTGQASGAAGSWRLWQHPLPPHHYLALAWNGPDAIVQHTSVTAEELTGWASLCSP